MNSLRNSRVVICTPSAIYGVEYRGGRGGGGGRAREWVSCSSRTDLIYLFIPSSTALIVMFCFCGKALLRFPPTYRPDDVEGIVRKYHHYAFIPTARFLRRVEKQDRR